MYTSADNKTENKSQSAALGPQEQKSGSGLQLQDNRPASLVQKKQVDALANKQNNAVPVQKKANNTGLPDTLKSGIESLSGHSMDDVKVHYNSSQPAQLNAHAYAQGTDIHVTSGQEKHLPHEAWHVVQQKQGRVKPTTQLKGKVNINDDEGLEKEADVMGAKSAKQTIQQKNNNNVNSVQKTATPVAQLYGPAEDAEQQAAGEAFEGLLHQYELLNADIIARRAAEQTAEGRPALLQDNIHLIELRQTILGQQEAINKELLTPGYRGLLETLNGVEPSDNVVENPTRIGKEIEVPSLVLKTRPALPNGVVLARTEAEELNFPVIKIETEGADRSKETSIEVIFGPLTTEEHDGDNFKFAKHALLVALASPTRATIGARIASYNAKLGAGRARFRLNVPEEVAGYISVSSKAQAKTNTQTNIAVPFASVGSEEGGIDPFFENESKESTGLFRRSRLIANDLAGAVSNTIGAAPSKNIASLFTQILYYDSMYGAKRIAKGRETKENKHSFHVMLKFSPQDAVFSILKDPEVLALHRWLNETEGAPIIQTMQEFPELNLGARREFATLAATASVTSLRRSVEERLLQGKQTLERVPSDANPTSATRSGVRVRHHLPRPSNRIPVSQDPAGESHVVIEQRSAGHPFNSQ